MAAGEAAEAANRLAVAVDDLGSGLWSGRVKQELEARTPLRNVLFSPSPSRPPVSVEELPIRFLDARNDPQLARLRQLSHSPAAWFRSPFVHVVLVSCLDYEDYKRDLRLRLKAMADTEAAASQPELLFVYVRPAAAEAAAKGPARVFDAMRKDLSRARRERCVRLDPVPVPATQPSAPAMLGLDEFDRQVRDALRTAFEARAAAYVDEVRRLMLNRLDPAWSFSTLFLVKDALAAMLEAAGLLEDALREYAELEAAYLEVLRAGQQPRQAFGSKPAGSDEAALMWSSWAATRQAASQPELPPEFLMRQALFASQARLLLKLHRHAEVAERGLNFVRSFSAILAQQQSAGAVPPLLREAWSFAGCLSLAEATLRWQAARAEEKRRTDHATRGGGRRGRLSDASPTGPQAAATTPGRAAAWERESAASAASSPVSAAGAGHPTLQVKVGPHSSDADSAASPDWPQASQQMQMDWQLGALPSKPAAAGAAAAGGGEGSAPGRGTPGGTPAGAAAGSAGLYCLLAKLYSTARAELLRLGAAVGLEVPECTAAALGGGREPRHLAAADATSAVAAARGTAPEASQPAPQQPSPAATSIPPSAPLADNMGGLPDIPSSSDMAQVPLDGADSGSRHSGQLPAAAAGTGGQQPPSPGAVTLESALEAQADAASETDSQRQQQQQTAAEAERLRLRPNAPGGEGDSPSSSPRSTSTHQSSTATPTRSEASRAVQPLAAGAAAAGAAAAAAVAGVSSSPPSARSEHTDMRSVERQVASALAERASRSAGGHVLAPKVPMSPVGQAAGLPPWLVHWRLRAALSSQHLFVELFVELSEAAARCFAACGHARSAALMRADVAGALARQGAMQRAAELYESQCRTLLREGWHALAAAMLPKLAACQLACGSPGLAHTAAALLALPPPFHGSPAQRQAACSLLLQAAQAAEGAAGSRPLPPPSPGAAGPLPPDAGISMSAAIYATPRPAAISRFFGRATPSGAPQLVPPPGPVGGGRGGALAAAVGDALPVQLLVDNQLPVGLPLREVLLTLAVLQEMTVIHSPRAAPSPIAVLGAAPRLARTGTPATPLADHLSLEPQGSGVGERYESRWQQVEELYCPLVAVSAVDAEARLGSSGGSGAAPRLQPLSGEVVLPRGQCLLTFLAAPVKRGLYKALHLRARLHQLPIHVAVHTPEPLRQRHGSFAGVTSRVVASSSAASSRRASRAGVPGGSPLAPEPPGSPFSAEAIVMLVESAQPRVQLSLLATGGSLIAGQEQWLGLALAADRDALHGAQLELTWPVAHPGSGGLGLPLPRKATALAPRHRAVHSHGGDMRLGSGGAPAALTATLATLPFIRPEHRAVVLAPSGASSSSAQGAEQEAPPAAVELLPAEGPAGPSAAWLLAEGLQQHVALPLVEARRPITLWWRVTAGEVAAPPEQVHITPPAPRHTSRQHDARRWGLPADSGPAPAAVLDVPASLEYASGCQRSHSRVLGAAVRQPFAVACAARELPSGGVAVQVTLTSSMAVPAQLSRLALEPQPGFVLTTNVLEAMGLLPASLAPGGSLVASFLLASEPPSSPTAGAEYAVVPAKLQPSALVVDYSVDSKQQCGVAVAPLATGGGPSTNREPLVGAASGAPVAGGGQSAFAAAAAADASAPPSSSSGSSCTPALEVLDLLHERGSRQRASSPLGSPSKRAAAAGSPRATAVPSPLAEEGPGSDSGGNGDASTRQYCSFRHLLTLEMPASEDDTAGALVYVRQLGPFVATVGQPTTLCWRLERSGAVDAGQPATRISFEVQAEGDHWRPLGRRSGGVTLAGHGGAVATVEATWVPLAAGTLAVPTLHLQDVNFQEVYDVGLSLSGTSAITVVDAY